MKMLRCRLRPLSAFATPLRGDTLFGQMCWALRHRHGEAALSGWLEGYTAGAPFLVVSDVFPSGFLPRPCVPLKLLGLNMDDPSQRKTLKAQVWVPVEALASPLSEWGGVARAASGLDEVVGYQRREALQQHNSLNRLTLTTGRGEGFAPFTRQMHWYGEQTKLDAYLLFDEERIDADRVHAALEDVGVTGYGKEASTGAGHFDVIECSEWQLPSELPAVNALLTLGPCAPQGGDWDASRCWYQPFVRFGRHGDMAVHGANPFKNPVLLADTAAVMTSANGALPLWVGRGLGGISHNLPAAVQQGYAPALPVSLGGEVAI